MTQDGSFRRSEIFFRYSSYSCNAGLRPLQTFVIYGSKRIHLCIKLSSHLSCKVISSRKTNIPFHHRLPLLRPGNSQSPATLFKIQKGERKP